MVFAEPRPADELPFTRGRRTVRAKLNAVMVTNGGEAFRLALLEGIGIGALPSFLACREAPAGRLERVLPHWALPELCVFALYPHRRFVSPKVRVFVDALRAAFGDGTTDPWWAGSGMLAGDDRRTRGAAGRLVQGWGKGVAIG